MHKQRAHQQHIPSGAFAGPIVRRGEALNIVPPHFAAAVRAADYGQRSVLGRRVVEVNASGNQIFQDGSWKFDVACVAALGPPLKPGLGNFSRDRHDDVLMSRNHPVRLRIFVEQQRVDREGA